MEKGKIEKNKTEKFSFRLTKEDKIYYSELAQKLGYTFSEFVLVRLFETPIINFSNEKYKWDAVKELSKELNFIGNNINQLTKEVHIMAKTQKTRMSIFDRILEELNNYHKLRNELINTISKSVF